MSIRIDSESSISESPAGRLVAQKVAAQALAQTVALRLAELSGEFAVIGLGKSGRAAALLLRRAGVPVYASDSSRSALSDAELSELRLAGVSVDSGSHDLERIAGAAVVVVSPGVPPAAKALAAARNAGVPITSEVEIALRLQPALRYVAVTGTNGKTTTTALVGHLLRALGHNAADAGNIGVPVASLALEEPQPDWAAIELSSFQLHDTPGIAPDVGVLTNLTPDHLDRYASVEEYYDDKRLLYLNAVAQSHWVANADSEAVRELVRGVPGHWHWFSTNGRAGASGLETTIRSDMPGSGPPHLVTTRPDAWLDRDGGQLMVLSAPFVSLDHLKLTGDHNVANVLAAVLAVMVADPSHRTDAARKLLAEAVVNFHALPNRLEPVADSNGILWLNDSKATNVDSTRVALKAMTRPTVLLLGGRHKGEPYTSLLPELRRTARAVLAYGEATAQLVHDLAILDDDAVVFEAMPDAEFRRVVQRARELALPGDVILLSPACSSYDMFANYEERGRVFSQLAGENHG